jgi:hypothetical protein
MQDKTFKAQIIVLSSKSTSCGNLISEIRVLSPYSVILKKNSRLPALIVLLVRAGLSCHIPLLRAVCGIHITPHITTPRLNN